MFEDRERVRLGKQRTRRWMLCREGPQELL